MAAAAERVEGGNLAVPIVYALHKTGQSEDDIRGLAERICTGAAVRTPRGDVVEGERVRFFARHAPGEFDREDWRRCGRRVAALAGREQGGETALLGLSHGANAALASLVTDPAGFARTILLRPAPLPEGVALPALGGMPVFVASGAMDRTVPLSGAQGIVALLRSAGATVTHLVTPFGHELNDIDISAAHAWWLHRAEASDRSGEGANER